MTIVTLFCISFWSYWKKICLNKIKKVSGLFDYWARDLSNRPEQMQGRLSKQGLICGISLEQTKQAIPGTKVYNYV